MNPPAKAGDTGSLGGDNPLQKEMATHSIFLPGESHGQRSLAGYIAHSIAESWTGLK